MMYRIDFKAMGCRMLAMLESSRPEAPEMLAQVPNWFEEWEQSLSRFRLDSELNHLNASAGWPVQVSQTLWDVFRTALEAEVDSQGLVRASVLQALLQAGYDHSFEKLPSQQPLPCPAGIWNMVPSLYEVQLDEERRTICLPADALLDFGGVAKGWAASQAAQRLAVLGPTLVSAGGDIAISGALSDGSLWPVTVDDPFHPGESITTLRLNTGGVATSGTDYHRWKQGGRWNHHIIDPRDGHPARTDLVAATIIAPSAAQAEMAAKTTLILGSQDGMRWVEARPDFSALLVLETGEIINSINFEPFFWRS